MNQFKYLTIIAILIVLITSEILFTATISGVVTGQNGEPLIYANVFLKNRVEGSITDGNGEFTIQTDANGQVTLICSFIGYEQYTNDLQLKPDSKIDLNIEMRETEIRGESVVVIASAFKAADEEGVTLTSLDVVRTPGAAADLFWAIKSFPGLQQVEDGAGLFVRGGDVSETVIMLDGAVMKHPYKYESPTGGFFGTFNPFLLKGTFFSSGGFSAQYGNALSGALVMESHDLPEQRYIGLGLGLAAESAYITLPIADDKFGISFSGNRSNTKMMFELNDNHKDFSHYPTSYDINLNAVYKINNNNRIKIFLYRENDEVGVEVDDPDFYSHFHGNTSNRMYNVKYRGLITDKMALQANCALSDFRQDITLSVMDLQMQDKIYQGRVSVDYELKPTITVRSGFGIFHDNTKIRGRVPENELDLNPEGVGEDVRTNYHSNRLMHFSEIEFPAPLGLYVITGVRGEYESISDEYFIDPRLSLTYPMTTHSNLTAAWGIYHQYPEAQYYDPYIGNPELASMRAVHYIFGYGFQKDDRIFRVEGYYKLYDHLLLENDLDNYSNNGDGYARGIDIFLKEKIGLLSGRISYSWLQARRKWMDSPMRTSPYFDITHNLTIIATVDLPRNVSIGSSYRYATGKPYTPAPDLYHRARVPDYQALDVTLSCMARLFEHNYTIFYFSMSNVFGRINIFDYRYSEDYQRRDAVESSFGRSVYFGVSFNMN